MQETDCPAATRAAKFESESIPFSHIPHQSKLFLQYQSDPLSLRNYYPKAVENHLDAVRFAPDVLSNYKTDRDALCDALAAMNRRFGAGEKTFENIELLRSAKTVTVLTGQQVGFLTGPLYTIYKALSAVKMAEELRCEGVDAVPVFWAATEDHDFAEVEKAYEIGADGKVLDFSVTVSEHADAAPVGKIETNESIRVVIDDLIDSLPQTEFSASVHSTLSESWRPGTDFGTAFSTMLAQVLSAYGVIVVDPLDEKIKALSSAIYANAAASAPAIVESLVSRSRELESAGFHSQVLIEEDYFPLFYHTDAGSRKSLKRAGDGKYRVSGEKTEFTLEQLEKIGAETPERLSPGVMLRPVVQDYLFPTLCYFGGAAEVAYFAQNSEVYRTLERPATTIFHRQSFTIIESKHRRALAKYDLKLEDLFGGFDALLPQIVEKYVNPGTTKLFAEAEEKINNELHRLDQNLSQVDVTLAENLATRRRKILYHIAALRKKFHRAQIRKDETVNRQLTSAFESLLPNGALQERTVNVVTYLNKYGNFFIDWVYNSIDLDDKGHRIVNI